MAGVASLSGFDQEMDQFLIAMVRDHRCLYDSADTNYRDNHFKEAVWAQIGADLSKSASNLIPAQVCKDRWRTIRDAYKKTKRKCDRGASVRSKYGINSNLSFIDDYFYGKNTKKVKPEPSEDEDGADQEEEMTVSCSWEVPQVHMLDTDTTTSDHLVHHGKAGRMAIRHDDYFYGKNTKKDKSQAGDNNEEGGDPEEMTVSCSWEVPRVHMLDTDAGTAGPARSWRRSPSEEAVDAFFASMAAIVKTFPPHMIAQTRMKVCNVVSEMEMTALEGKEAGKKS